MTDFLKVLLNIRSLRAVARDLTFWNNSKKVSLN